MNELEKLLKKYCISSFVWIFSMPILELIFSNFGKIYVEIPWVIITIAIEAYIFISYEKASKREIQHSQSVKILEHFDAYYEVDDNLEEICKQFKAYDDNLKAICNEHKTYEG